MSAPIVLALDPATRNVGWCVGQGESYIDSGTLELYGDAWIARLTELALELRAMMARFDPDVLAVEEPMGDHGNRATDRKLGAAFGVALAMAALDHVEFMAVHPTHVKDTGVHKRTPPAYLVGLTGKFVSSGDEKDAVGVWMVASGRMKERALGEREASV